MPPVQSGQVWWPEVVAHLRSSWQADMAWEDIVLLRDQLQALLDDIRRLRGVRSPVFRCPDCGHRGPAAPPAISVRALLLALKRFGIESEQSVSILQLSWMRHRVLHPLDLFGRPAGEKPETGHRH